MYNKESNLFTATFILPNITYISIIYVLLLENPKYLLILYLYYNTVKGDI